MKPISSVRMLTAVAITGLALIVPNAAFANPDLYKKALPSTVWVVTPLSKDKMSAGTGVLVDTARKLVVTNAHVVQDKKEAVVFFPAFEKGTLITAPKYYVDNREKIAILSRVLHRDVTRDLAILELQKLPTGARAIPLASASPAPGQGIHAIGNSGMASGGLWRYSDGKVRLVYTKKINTADGGIVKQVNTRIVETTIPINQGDSGGPNLNDRGELVSISESFDPKNRSVSNSVDVNEVRSVIATATKASSATAQKPADSGKKLNSRSTTETSQTRR